MKSNKTIIIQALVFALVLTLANTVITAWSDPRGFSEIVFRLITLIQFLLLALIWGTFLYFRNERIKKQK